MTDDSAKETLIGARTQPDPERAAKIGDAPALAEAAMADLAAQIAQAESPDQPSLLEDEPCLFAGPVAHVAETFAAARGRGRPKGSKNRGNQQLREYLLGMGYRHPALNLADLANADPHELAAELSEPYRPKKGPHAGELVEASCTPVEAMELIRKANAELLPYFESKRPTELNVNERTLGVLVIESGGQTQSNGGFMSLTGEVSESDDISDT